MHVWYSKFFSPMLMNAQLMRADFWMITRDTRCWNYLNVKADNKLCFLIPPHFTFTVQLSDISINNPLKDQLKKIISHWRDAPYAELISNQKVSSPAGGDRLQ